MSPANSGSLLDRAPIAQGIVAGLVAWVVNLVVIVGLVAGAESPDDTIGFGGNVMYNAHFARSKAKQTGPIGSASDTGSMIAGSMTDLADVVYYAVPIVVLVLVGIALARVAARNDPDAAAVGGAAMAGGYVLLTVIGTQLFEVSSESGWFGLSTTTVTPMLSVATIATMGLLYPVLFGGLGAAIGSRL
ncbi:hypothetical protein GCM10028857_27990 [Salinarchaeum chitinilyticum]